MAKKQSLVGICFAGVQKLYVSDNPESTFDSPEATKNPESITKNLDEVQYLRWMGMAAKIQQRNEVMDGYTERALESFRKDGFACTTLKGQGIAKLYGTLAGLRQSGDIDLWVQGGRKRLYEYSLKTFGKLEGLTYHHIHFPVFDDAEVEAHVWPAFFTSPFANRCFHKFCRLHAPKANCADTPSLAFNRVFILQHCYGHFCGHGVGFRQLLDYYFVLMQGFSEEERTESMRWIERLGMKRFTAAVMWLCREVFGMPDGSRICEPNEKDGRFLLEEVLETGNMGHHDERVDKRELQSPTGRYLHNLKRDWRVARIAPHYALWEPLWGIFQFCFCKYISLKYKRKNT